MLEKFIEPSTEYTAIPLTGGRYRISLDGVIIDQNNDPVLTKIIDGEHHSYISLWNGATYHKTAIIVNLTFKPVHIPSQYYKLLDVLYIDGNPLNLHPSNIIWSNKVKIGTSQYPGFYFIPGVSRYLINEDGVIINYLSGKSRRPKTRKLSRQYEERSIILDTDKPSGLGLHRLLCLVFKEYPSNVDKLDVNHIDLNPSNNHLDNLEWVSRKRNIEHALENKTDSFNTRVLVRDIATNKIMEFNSLNECGRYFNVSTEAIRYRCAAKNNPIFKKRYQFRFKNKDHGWNRVCEHESNIDAPVTRRDIFTSDIKHYYNVDEAARDIKSSPSGIINHELELAGKKPLGRYIFKFTDSPLEWPVYDEDELEIYRQCLESGNHLQGLGYIIIDVNTGERFLYANVYEAAKKIGFSRTGLYKVMFENRIVNNRWRVISFFKDKKYKEHN